MNAQALAILIDGEITSVTNVPAFRKKIGVVSGTDVQTEINIALAIFAKKQKTIVGKTGPQGPAGDSVGNMDGGGPTTVYGGLPIIDGGAV